MTALLTLLRRNRRAYLALNLAYYGLVALAMVWVARNPALEQGLREGVRGRFNPALMNAYAEGRVLPAIALTFRNNFFLAALLAITLPSLAIPFWGVAIGLARAVLWGLALSPADPAYAARFFRQVPTLLLEGQGFVLAMLGVWLLWRAVLRPAAVGAATRRAGYRVGLRQNAVLYGGVAALLLAAAIYEAVAAIYLAPR